MKKREYDINQLIKEWQAFDFKKAVKKIKFDAEVKKIIKEPK